MWAARLMYASPAVQTLQEQERLLGTPRADDSHSTLAGLPQLAGAGIERRSGGSGVSDVALGARPQARTVHLSSPVRYECGAPLTNCSESTSEQVGIPGLRPS